MQKVSKLLEVLEVKIP